MCFSAEASFIAAAILLCIGGFVWWQAKHSSYAYIALFPAFFGLQQGFEGVVWLGVDGVVSSAIQLVAGYAFLSFAVVLWPLLFAVAAYTIETKRFVREKLQWFLAAGTVWSIVSAGILAYADLSVVASGEHIIYDVVALSQWMTIPLTLIYAGIGLIPLFLSSVKRLRVFGWLVFVSGGITWVVETAYFVSLWCFWAAILSASIYIVIPKTSIDIEDVLRRS